MFLMLFVHLLVHIDFCVHILKQYVLVALCIIKKEERVRITVTNDNVTAKHEVEKLPSPATTQLQTKQMLPNSCKANRYHTHQPLTESTDQKLGSCSYCPPPFNEFSFETLKSRTVKFQNSLIPYSLIHYLQA